jgi:predicted dinucleotide-binding enzyme
VDAQVVSIGEALDSSDVVILAIPGQSVSELGKEFGSALGGKLVIDATNRMGQTVVNSRADLPSNIRYARAFNTLGGENFANPVFRAGTADLFFSAPPGDRAVLEEIIRGIGLGPVYVGEDREELIDALFVLWIELAMKQGRGRHLALKLLQD